jgi:hypothetical protein
MQPISPEQLNRYQASARQHQAQRQQRYLKPQQQGWQVARQSAHAWSDCGQIYRSFVSF